MQLPTWLQSSADATKLSLTVKGVASSVVPVLLLVAKAYGSELTGEDVNEALDAVLNVLLGVTGLVTVVLTAIGSVRKVVNKLKK